MMIIAFRDLFNRKKILYVLFSIVAAFVLTYNYTLQFNRAVFLISIAVVTFLSTMQICYSYFVKERVVDYYQLPMKTNSFYQRLIICIFLFNFLERVFIISIIFNEYLLFHPIDFAVYVLYSLHVIIVCFLCFVTLQNTGDIWLKIMKLLFYFVVGSLPIVIQNNVVVFILFIVMYLQLMSVDQFVFISERAKVDLFLFHKNYFLSSIMKDVAFFINVLFVLVFSLYLLFQDVSMHVVIPMVFTVISLNSIIMTLISADRGTLKQIQSLPKSNILLMMYFRLLLGYFALLNGVILTVAVYFNRLPFNVVTLGYVVLLVVFESVFSVLLELYFPLAKWHLKKDLWKSPRKYILACLVYFITFSVSFFF